MCCGSENRQAAGVSPAGLNKDEAMSNATVVIGAGYGDEGKGLTTDYLTAVDPDNTIVVRFNGGAQAGHTVQTTDGKRHVFSHFGSGTFSGAATYLSRFFVCHPMLFHEERRALAALGLRPRVLVDPEAPVTTPYDVMINQQLEMARGAGRHGSCGIGFGETIDRIENSAFGLSVVDLLEPAVLIERLDQIRRRYLPDRLARLKLRPLDKQLLSDDIFDRFVDDALCFIEHVTLHDATALDASSSNIVFEGAQGLRLDMERGEFPHVTRSSTGLKNVVALATEANIPGLEVVYATRAYLTRHGAGPLAWELSAKPYPRVTDQTNLSNTWQGSLRFAWLDLDEMQRYIRDDLSEGRELVTSTTLMVSCLDQIDETVEFIERGRTRSASVERFLDRAARTIPTQRLLTSFGPTRADIREIRPSNQCLRSAQDCARTA